MAANYLLRDSMLANNKSIYMHLIAEEVLAQYILLGCVCFDMLYVLK